MRCSSSTNEHNASCFAAVNPTPDVPIGVVHGKVCLQSPCSTGCLCSALSRLMPYGYNVGNGLPHVISRLGSMSKAAGGGNWFRLPLIETSYQWKRMSCTVCLLVIGLLCIFVNSGTLEAYRTTGLMGTRRVFTTLVTVVEIGAGWAFTALHGYNGCDWMHRHAWLRHLEGSARIASLVSETTRARKKRSLECRTAPPCPGERSAGTRIRPCCTATCGPSGFSCTLATASCRKVIEYSIA